MPTITDEEYGPDGTLIRSVQRTVIEEFPLMVELYETRKQVKAIALNPLVPGWGRILAKFLILLSHWMVAERNSEDAPII